MKSTIQNKSQRIPSNVNFPGKSVNEARESSSTYIEKQAASISTKTENDPQKPEKGPALCMKIRGKTTRKRQEAQDFSASAGLPWEQGRLPDSSAAQKSEKVRNPKGGGQHIISREHCMPM
ncbi:MAG: hypothetical protein ACI4AJ_06365, partial [Bacteroidaceae bacterium]